MVKYHNPYQQLITDKFTIHRKYHLDFLRKKSQLCYQLHYFALLQKPKLHTP
jgi:hypothetical protein